MATPEKRHRAVLVGLLAVGLLGGLMVVAAKALSGLAMIFVGGAEFAGVEGQLWVFAVLGTVLAMLQLLVYAVLARQGRRSVWFVWGALLALVLIGLQTDSLSGLVSVAVGVDTVLLLVLTLASLRLARQQAPTPARGTMST